MQELENDLKALIVEALMLDTVRPAEIDSEAPLFGAGLGLDSIDALELAMAIERRYGVKLRADDPNTRAVFASVRSLAGHVRSQQKG
jgi:acyl carrier protein